MQAPADIERSETLCARALLDAHQRGRREGMEEAATMEKQMTDLNEKALEAARASFVMENSLKRAIRAYLETAQSEDKIDEVNP